MWLLCFQLSSACDFCVDCLGYSFYLWNPLLFCCLDRSFREAAREYVNQEVMPRHHYDFFLIQYISALSPPPDLVSPSKPRPLLLLLAASNSSSSSSSAPSAPSAAAVAAPSAAAAALRLHDASRAGPILSLQPSQAAERG